MIITCHDRGAESERQPHHGRGSVKDTGRKDADNRVTFCIQHDLAADNLGVAAKPALPNAVREHYFLIFANLVFVRSKRASQLRADAKHFEIRYRNSLNIKFPGLVRAGQRHRVPGDGRQILKTAILPVPIEEVQRGNGVTKSKRILFPHTDNPFGMRIGERLEQRGIHKTENRRVGADTERERSNSNRGKARTLAQITERVIEVLSQMIEPRPCPHTPCIFHHNGAVTEGLDRGLASSRRIQSAVDLFFRLACDVRLQLPLHGRLPRSTAEPPFDAFQHHST